MFFSFKKQLYNFESSARSIKRSIMASKREQPTASAPKRKMLTIGDVIPANKIASNTTTTTTTTTTTAATATGVGSPGNRGSGGAQSNGKERSHTNARTINTVRPREKEPTTNHKKAKSTVESFLSPKDFEDDKE